MEGIGSNVEAQLLSQLAGTGLCGLLLAIVGYLYIRKDRELREALERHAEETTALQKAHALEFKEARDKHAADMKIESGLRIDDSNRLNKNGARHPARGLGDDQDARGDV